LAISIAADSWFYGKLVIVPWNFFKINVVQDISTQYGHEPWHYYLTSTLLPVANLALLYLPFGVAAAFKGRKATLKALIISTFWTLGLFSLLRHKEQRFILPVLPVLLAFSAKGLPAISRKFKTAYVAINLAALAFLVSCHKVGSTNVISYLSSQFATNDDNNSKSGVLLLLPCHHTPLYSHFHHDYPMEFLHCPPALGAGQAKRDLDESDAFFDDPGSWLNERFGSDLKSDLYSHIVLYDKTAEFPAVQKYLRANGMHLCEKFFQTLIHAEIEKYGLEITVYCKKDKAE